VRYQISCNKELLEIVIPFFERHKLIGKKKFDFNLWKEAVVIIKRNKKEKTNSQTGTKGFIENKWNDDDLNRLNKIREEMKKYKSGSDGRTLKY